MGGMGSVQRLLDAVDAEERDDPAGALARAEAALVAAHRLAPGPARDRLTASAAWRIARCRLLARDAEGALAAVAAHRERVRAAGEPGAVARLLETEGVAFSSIGHLPAALEALDEALRHARASGDGPTLRSVEMNRAAALRRHGALEEAAAACDRILAHAEALPPLQRIKILQNAASTFWQVDRAEEAAARLAEARSLAGAADLGGGDAWQEALEAWVALGRGDLPGALAAGERCLALAGRGDPAAVESGTRALARALGHGVDGDAGRARAEALLRGLADDARDRDRHADHAMVAEELADVLAAGGRTDEAHAAAREALEAERRAHRALRDVLARAEQRRLELARLEVEATQLRLHNEALADLSGRLEQVSEERARLLATVAHDLRTPLTALGCSLDLYRSAPAQLEHLLRTVSDSVELMQSLIDEALAVEAIAAGRAPVRLRRVELVAAVRRLLSGLAALAERKGLAVELAAPRRVEWVTDPTAFARVVENLVSNALKYTPPGGRIRLSLAQEGTAVRFTAQDGGPGFDGEDPAALFALGVTGRAAPTGGEARFGLGLGVVADLCRALGGEVRASNAPEGGALVEVWLPMPSRSPDEPTSASSG